MIGYQSKFSLQSTPLSRREENNPELAEAVVQDTFEEISAEVTRHAAVIASLNTLRANCKTVMKQMSACIREFKKLITDFDQQHALTKGTDFYFSHLKFNSQAVIEAIDAEIETSRNSQEKCELQIKQRMQSMLQYFDLDQPVDYVKLTAAKSLRKLPVFGCRNDKFDFEWPTLADLLKSPPQELSAIVWKEHGYLGNTYIGGIQLEFANGLKSPIVFGKDVPKSNLKRAEIKGHVARMKSDSDFTSLQQLELIDSNNQSLLKINCGTRNPVKEVRLTEKEQVVGIYGCKSSPGCFSSLGFIVWVPGTSIEALVKKSEKQE